MSSRQLQNGKSFTVCDEALSGTRILCQIKDLDKIGSPKTQKERRVKEGIEQTIKRLRITAPPTPTIVFQERALQNSTPSCLNFGVYDDFKKSTQDTCFAMHVRCGKRKRGTQQVCTPNDLQRNTNVLLATKIGYARQPK